MKEKQHLIIRPLGVRDYAQTYQAMKAFTNERHDRTADEIWYLEHPPVYTLGMAARKQHILDAGQIAVIQSDRGGQVTYHGPGQLVVYLLINLKRHGFAIKDFVRRLEQSLIDMLSGLDISAGRKPGAPGVYIAGKKIAALGIRVRKDCCYHGLSFNIDMDKSPFAGIDPCGYPGLEVTQLRDYGITLSTGEAARMLLPYLYKNLHFEPDNFIIETRQDLPAQDQAAA